VTNEHGSAKIGRMGRGRNAALVLASQCLVSSCSLTHVADAGASDDSLGSVSLVVTHFEISVDASLMPREPPDRVRASWEIVASSMGSTDLILVQADLQFDEGRVHQSLVVSPMVIDLSTGAASVGQQRVSGSPSVASLLTEICATGRAHLSLVFAASGRMIPVEADATFSCAL